MPLAPLSACPDGPIGVLEASIAVIGEPEPDPVDPGWLMTTWTFDPPFSLGGTVVSLLFSLSSVYSLSIFRLLLPHRRR